MRLTDTSDPSVPGAHLSGADVPGPSAPGPIPARRRRLRAVFAADIANFGGLVSVDETSTLDLLWIIRRVATEELATHGGWLFGLPGDGIFALFESTVDAVRCALRIQSRLAESPKLYACKLRIGVHLGEVLFQDELPCGEALVIASRLESLAEPGGILVSAAVMDAISSHIAATFISCGVPTLKHCPRRIETFRVIHLPSAMEPRPASGMLDSTFAPEPVAPRQPAPDPASVDALATVLSADAPLAVPFVSFLQSEAPSQIVEDAGFDDRSLARLALLLTIHLGPVAKVLVRRRAAVSRDSEQLVLMLAEEIRNYGDRLKFLMRARAELSGPH